MSSYYVTSLTASSVRVIVSKAWLKETGFSDAALSSISTMTQRSILQIKDSSLSNNRIRMKPSSVDTTYSSTHILLVYSYVPIFSGISTLTAMFEDGIDADNNYTTTRIYNSVTVTHIAENTVAYSPDNRGLITFRYSNIQVAVPSKLVPVGTNVSNIKFKVTGVFDAYLSNTASIYLSGINMYTAGHTTYITSESSDFGFMYNNLFSFEVFISSNSDLDGSNVTSIVKIGSGSFRVVELNTQIEIRD